MVDDSLPQWIRTYPEEAAPRTGDGLFPGEVIEVVQVKTYARVLRYLLALRCCSIKLCEFITALQYDFVPQVVDRSATKTLVGGYILLRSMMYSLGCKRGCGSLEKKYPQSSSYVYLAQVLTNKEKVFLRIANDRGWTYAKNPADDSTLFEEISGDIAEDK